MNRKVLFLLVSLFSLHSVVQSQSQNNNIPDNLTIIGTNIWIRAEPVTGKVVMKLNDGDHCKVLKQGLQQTIRGNSDYWYQIEYKGKTGWLFGSQSSIRQQPTEFVTHLKNFLKKDFFYQDMRGLIHDQNSKVMEYIHKKISVQRLYNPGAACVTYQFEYSNGYSKPKDTKTSSSNIYNKPPVNGFCEESPDRDGFYILSNPKLPGYYDMEEDTGKRIKLPKEYADIPIKLVYQLQDGYIFQKLYFAYTEGKWWLFLIDDCDCSA